MYLKFPKISNLYRKSCVTWDRASGGDIRGSFLPDQDVAACLSHPAHVHGMQGGNCHAECECGVWLSRMAPCLPFKQGVNMV